MNPKMRAAHHQVYLAVNDGTLQRQPCEHCGNPKAVAHHEDYDKPLDVQWLCTPCHLALHKKTRRDAIIDTLRDLRAMGLSYREIERVTGVNYHTAFGWLRE